MSQISQLSKLAIPVTVCITASVPHTTSQFLSNQTCCLRTLSWQKLVFTISSCSRHKANVTAMFAKKRGGHYLPQVQFWTWLCVDSWGASYTWTSTDSDSSLLTSGSPQTRTDSVQTRLVSLICNSQFRCTERDRTATKSQSNLRRCRSKSACFLYVVGSAVIGSGAHVTVVAPVDNACGIFKAFMK